MIIRDSSRIKGKEVLIDTNLLVYSSNTVSTKNKIAVEFRELAVNNFFVPVVAHQNILEMIRVLTHSKYEKPYTLKKALEQSENFENLCRVIYPDSGTLKIAKAFAIKYKINSNIIFDCYLVATMLSNDIKIIATDNVKDMGIFEEINVYNPYK